MWFVAVTQFITHMILDGNTIRPVASLQECINKTTKPNPTKLRVGKHD